MCVCVWLNYTYPLYPRFGTHLASYRSNLLAVCFDMSAPMLHCLNHTVSHYKRHTHRHAHTASYTFVNTLSMCHWRPFCPTCGRRGGARTQPFVCRPRCRATSPDNGAIESEFALTHLAVSGLRFFGVCGAR